MAGHGKETQRRATGKASGIDRTVRLKALWPCASLFRPTHSAGQKIARRGRAMRK
jgi:hypothetical protein